MEIPFYDSEKLTIKSKFNHSNSKFKNNGNEEDKREVESRTSKNITNQKIVIHNSTLCFEETRKIIKANA